MADVFGHNILELCKAIYRSNLQQAKRDLVSSITSLVYEWPHELPNELRLRILEKQGIVGKIQISVEI